MHEFEKRVLPAQHCELRAIALADGSAGVPRIGGYAAVFGMRSDPIYGSFVEEIEPGAFDKVLGQDVRALFNHDPNYLLGRTVSATLRLSVDSRGLAYEIDPPDTQTVRDLVIAPMSRGDMSGSSFTFRVAPGGDKWREEGGLIIRTITEIAALRDVGPVAFPAYPDATAAQRSLDAWKQSRDGDEAVRALNERAARARELDLMNA